MPVARIFANHKTLTLNARNLSEANVPAHPPITVTFFHRRHGPGHFSLERVFASVRARLSADIRPVVAECPRESKGILNRMINILWAHRHQGDVNHVTGDVHYLTYLLKKKRTVLTIADCVALEYSRGLKHFLLWFFWYWLPEKRCSRITVISEFTKQQLLTHLRCRPEKIEVLHCSVPEGFKASQKPFNADCPVILHVGTSRNKNLERVAQALKGFPCHLEIVGPLSHQQQNILEENGIAYTSHVGVSDEELLTLYRSSDLVVFASLYEGFGLPILEAQAVGRPVVTSDRCSMPEVAGDAACLVDPESVWSIRAGLLKIIQNRPYREELVRKGYANAKRFEPTRISSQYATLYQAPSIRQHQSETRH